MRRVVRNGKDLFVKYMSHKMNNVKVKYNNSVVWVSSIQSCST